MKLLKSKSCGLAHQKAQYKIGPVDTIGLEGENRMSKQILRAAIWIAVVGCLASVALGFIGSIVFDFEAAPIIGTGSIIAAILCAMVPVMIKTNEKKDEDKE